MLRLIALYRRPDDERAFLDWYEGIHAPLARALPNLRDFWFSKAVRTVMGEPAFFMMAELTFDDRRSFDEAMASPENQACAADLKSFAADVVTLIVVEGA